MKARLLTIAFLLLASGVFAQVQEEEVPKDTLCDDLKMGVYQTSHNHPSADAILMMKIREEINILLNDAITATKKYFVYEEKHITNTQKDK